jgi:uncharacterized RDD family membrane protein YckC
MTMDDAPSPLMRPGIGHPGVDWSGDGGLGGTNVADEVVTRAGGAVPASVGRRAAGFLIDTAVLLGLAVVVSTFVVLFSGIDTSASQEEIQRQVDDLYPLLYVLEGILQFCYNLIWNSIGWSPGKRLLGMRTVDAEGAAPGFRRGFRRTIGAVLSGSLFGLGYAWAVWDREHRTWHDKMAKTYVVHAAGDDERARPG